MALDRYGERVDQKPPPACGRPSCRGWNGVDDEGRPIPCLICKPHLAKTVHSNDISESIPSARAQQAIERANQENP